MKKVFAILAVLGALIALSSCGSITQSDADTANKNLSTAADNFEVQRLIIGVDAISDKPAFLVEGRCSIEPEARILRVTCKHGENDYRKHHLGFGDNVYWTSTQLEGIDVSVYHTRIILKPQSVVPNLDLSVGKQ